MEKFKKVINFMMYVLALIFLTISVKSLTVFTEPGLSFSVCVYILLCFIIYIAMSGILLLLVTPKFYNKLSNKKYISKTSLIIVFFICAFVGSFLRTTMISNQANNLGFESSSEFSKAKQKNIFNPVEYKKYLDNERLKQEKLEQEQEQKRAQEEQELARWNGFEQKLDDTMNLLTIDPGAGYYYCFDHYHVPKYSNGLALMLNYASENNIISSQSADNAQKIYDVLHTDVSSAPETIKNEVSDKNSRLDEICTKLGEEGTKRLYN